MYMRMREYNTMLLLHNYMMWREALIYYLLQYLCMRSSQNCACVNIRYIILYDPVYSITLTMHKFIKYNLTFSLNT